MSHQKKIVTEGGGGGKLVAILCEEINAWDKILRY
jgi:hypothetical protein